MSQQKIILIGGPTASGKSALAMECARNNKGTVINADAMQLYRGLPILSAQPSSAEQDEIPHELYGVTDPAEASSAGQWLSLVTPVIAKTLAEGRTPILVGGTGLYFRALLGGLAEIPPIPDEVRAKTQELYDTLGEEAFRAALARLDPASAARIARNDRQRLIRAYEVVAHTGTALGEWQGKGSGFRIQGSGTFETHLLSPSRETLYPACDQRFLNMIERGAIGEVKNFLQRNLAPTLPAMKTIGVREIGAYLKGEWTLEQAVSKAQQATRNYAKRQTTWFRNQGLGVRQEKSHPLKII